jgi:hypothetical protein
MEFEDIRRATDEESLRQDVGAIGQTGQDIDDFWMGARDFFEDSTLQDVVANVARLGRSSTGVAMKLFVRELTAALVLAASDPGSSSPLHAELALIVGALLNPDHGARQEGLNAFRDWAKRATAARIEEEMEAIPFRRQMAVARGC